MYTKEMLKSMSTKEIEKKMEEIRNECAHWKSCMDGSYERAMSDLGFFELWDELVVRQGL